MWYLTIGEYNKKIKKKTIRLLEIYVEHFKVTVFHTSKLALSCLLHLKTKRNFNILCMCRNTQCIYVNSIYLCYFRAIAPFLFSMLLNYTYRALKKA